MRKRLAVMGSAIALSAAAAGSAIALWPGSAATAAPGDAAIPYPQPAPAPEWRKVLAQGDANRGRTYFLQGYRAAFPGCVSCHGPNGLLQGASAGGPVPRLAGLSSEYVAETLFAYKHGIRGKDNLMQQVAAKMSPREIADAAQFIGTLPAPPVNRAAAANGPADARRLNDNGDNARAIPACANCHGPQGIGETPTIPPLAGLSAEYTTHRLDEWKHRNNQPSTSDTMAAISHRMSQGEIEDLAAYYAGMRIRQPSGTP